MLRNYFKISALLLSTTIYSMGAITGTAYRDYNADGIKQGGEPGVANVIVKAYTNSSTGKDSKVTETTTGSDGNYTLDIPSDLSLIHI